MKKLLAAVLAASMCLSYATFASAAQQSSRGLARTTDSQFKVEFSATGGTVTAAYAQGDSNVTGAKNSITVDSGTVVTFTAKGEDESKTYTAEWTGDGVTAEAGALTATLKVTKAATVGVTLTEKTAGDTFKVTIDKETKGGLLDIYDTTAKKYLPVGEDVKIPKGNKLKIDWIGADGAELDQMILDGKPVDMFDEITVDNDMTLSATFKASTPSETEELYYVKADPSEFVSADPLTVSGTLKFWYWDGKQTSENKLLSGATFKFSDGYDNSKFTLTESGAFTSKEPLPTGDYVMQIDVTHGGKTYAEEQADIHVVDGKMVSVSFRRYIANNAGSSPIGDRVEVSIGTKFSAVAKPKMPLMYNHATVEKWQSGSAAIADEFVIERNLRALAVFADYSVTMLDLDGKPVDPEKPDPDPDPAPPSGGGGSSGGGGGGGGGGSVLGGGGSTGSNSGSSTVSTGTATKEATKAVENAVKAAVNAGSKSANAAVTFKNVKTMTPDAFKAINSAAAKASKGVAVKTSVQMDTVVNGKVEARMYIDPTLAAGLKTAIKTTVDVSSKSKENAKAAAVVSKYFSNTAAVVSFAQQGAFGMNVKAAVKVDTTKLDVKTLVLYSYDAKTNKFTVLPAPEYFVDSAGYLHFTTPVGGSIVITDKPLSRK